MNANFKYVTFRLALAVSLLFLIFVTVEPVSAATITVSSSCTLHDAIRSANGDLAIGGCEAGNGDDVIQINSNVTLTASAPTIRSVITVKGGSSKPDIDGGSRQIFKVHGDGTDSVKLTVDNLNLKNGRATLGGAIYVQFATLVIKNSEFNSNQAQEQGGAIWAYETHTTIINSKFNGNSALDGGAIYSSDLAPDDGTSLSVSTSTFTSNQATGSSGTSRGYGGAIHNAKGQLEVKRSYFKEGRARIGGAIAGGLSASIDVENSTFHLNGNVSTTSGGAISQSGRMMKLRNNTFKDNTATDGAALKTGSSWSEVHLYNTIIVGSGDSQCSVGGGFPTNGSNKHGGNHVADGSCSSKVDSGSINLGSITGTPAYFPLQDGSLAIDAGVNGDGKCASVDIVGTSRPQNSTCDIGAFELVHSSGQTLAEPTATATAAPPSPPADLSARKVSSGVKLTWTASGDAENGYRLLRYRPGRGETEPQQLTLITIASLTSFTDSTANTQEVFVYHIQSVRGALLSELSNEARIDLSPTETPTSTAVAATNTPTPTNTAVPLGMPTNLTASVVDSGVVLNWSAPAGQVDGYEILRRRPQQGEQFATLVADTGSSATTYTDSRATQAGQRYVYRVKAIRAGVRSEHSNFARADRPAATHTPAPTNTSIPPTNTQVPPPATNTPLPPTNTALPPPPTNTSLPPTATSEPATATSIPLGSPTNLTASIIESGVTLSWDAPAGQVDGYEILRRRPQQGENQLQTFVADTGRGSTTYTDSSATEAGQRYVYRVKAIRNGTRSEWSNFARADRP